MKTKHKIGSASEAEKPMPELINSPNPLPSIETLAMIAANVSDGLGREPGALIDYAFRLWINAREKLREECEDNDSIQTYDAVMGEWSERISLPQEFPASFEQFLASVVAAKVPADSFSRFRKFLYHKFKKNRAQERLAELRSSKFTYDTWVEWAEAYLAWWKTQRSKIAKENREKRLQ